MGLSMSRGTFVTTDIEDLKVALDAPNNRCIDVDIMACRHVHITPNKRTGL